MTTIATTKLQIKNELVNANLGLCDYVYDFGNIALKNTELGNE